MITNNMVAEFLKSSDFKGKLNEEMYHKIGTYVETHQFTHRIRGYDDNGYYFDEGSETNRYTAEYYNYIKSMTVINKEKDDPCFLIIKTVMFNMKFEFSCGCPILCWIKTNKFKKNTAYNVSMSSINNIRSAVYDIFMNFCKKYEPKNNEPVQMDMNNLVVRLCDLCGDTYKNINRRKHIENKFKEIFSNIPGVHYEKFTVFKNKIRNTEGNVTLTFKECYLTFVYSYKQNEDCQFLIDSFIRSRCKNNNEYKVSLDFLLATNDAKNELSRTLTI